MKKSLLLICSILFGFNGKAQLPELNFDVLWNNSLASSTVAPSGWITTNLLTSVLISSLNPVSVFPSTVSCTGNTSMRIETKTYPTRGLLATNVPDTAGFAFAGSIVVGNPTPLKDGFAYTQRPTHLVYCVQTQPAPGDTSGIMFRLWKTTNGIRTYISTVTETFTSASALPTMVTHTLPIEHANTLTPDSAGFYVASSFKFPSSGLIIRKGAKIGSYIAIDGLTLGVNIGINETAINLIDLNVFPNPSHQPFITMQTENTEATRYYISDVSGREITTGVFESGKAIVKTQDYNSGIYFYKVTNAQGQYLKTGKLIIN